MERFPARARWEEKGLLWSGPLYASSLLESLRGLLKYSTGAYDRRVAQPRLLWSISKQAPALASACDESFPLHIGRLRLWRGAASINTGDWKTAVDLLTATLNDRTKRDLHLDAALNPADVFMRLVNDPTNRPGIVTALARNPSARERFKQFMYSETLGARLRCMEGYLEAAFSK